MQLNNCMSNTVVCNNNPYLQKMSKRRDIEELLVLRSGFNPDVREIILSGNNEALAKLISSNYFTDVERGLYFFHEVIISERLKQDVLDNDAYLIRAFQEGKLPMGA